MGSELVKGLNPEQGAAVTSTQGPLLILAGAGSGKTRVLTHRIAYLIKEQGASPQQILAITFTNKAAKEMKERVSRLLGQISREMWVSTFHSSCVRILRRDIERLGYRPNFVIYDSGDQLDLIRDCLKKLNLDDKKNPPRAIVAEISRAKNELQTPEQVTARAAGDWSATALAKIYTLYQRRLRENNALDFDDLIMLTVQLFHQYPEVLAWYQERFRYILVDEYQDTNHAQYTLVRSLAEKHRNLCVVGDDDQSIYRFRGADVRNILEFEKDYPEARVIRLEQNYRSTKTILTAANAVVSLNRGRKRKKLWTENAEGDPVLFFKAADEKEEARFVAERIYRLHYETELGYGNFAVLYRTNAQSRVIEEGLLKAGIPYTIVGGLKFYDRKEIKDLLAYLRVLINPADSVSLKRIINVPRRGIGDTSLLKCEDYAVQNSLTMLEALQQAPQNGEINARSAGKMREFAGMIVELANLWAGEREITGIVGAVLNRSGYLAALEAERTAEAETRIENLKEFMTVTKEFDRRQDVWGLEAFLAEVALVADVDTLAAEREAVVLMTVHSAKGLEFPIVFITGLEEGIFPHQRSIEDPDDLEEERRLCYVALTRAQDKLVLSHAFQRTIFGHTVNSEVSRFCQEIPGEILEEHHGWASWNRAAGDDRAAAGTWSGKASRTEYMVNPRGKHISEPARPAADFRAGDRVEHKQWGQGVVVKVAGEGEDTEVTVAFPDRGLKKLAIRFAPLRKV